MEFLTSCSYIPLEIPLACGLPAKRLTFCAQNSRSGRAGSSDLLPRDFCPYARAFARQFGPDQIVAIAGSCDAMRRAYDTLAYWNMARRVYFVDVPRTADPAAAAFYAEELRRFAGLLEPDGEAGADRDGRLWLAIELMDGIRRSMRQSLEAMGAGRMCASRAFALAIEIGEMLDAAGGEFTEERARGVMLAVHTAVSRALLEAGAEAEPNDRADRMPVGVSGTCLLDATLIESLEDAGFDVVFVDSCVMSRSVEFSAGGGRAGSIGDAESGANAGGRGDPFRALAYAYLTKPPCPRMFAGAARAEYLESLSSRSGAKGIVYFAPKFCDLAYYDFAEVRSALESAGGLPVLLVEGEFDAGRTGQIITRVTAFREMLQRR